MAVPSCPGSATAPFFAASVRPGLEEEDRDAGEIEIASTDLPAFLTEDEPVTAALNGTSAT
jgi:hypothetical protein